ncbi:fumarylacetoacetate hydrolase family protein [Rhizobium sp. RHZ02]|uniref:fumarylacetoacetate hydrolase family protein n=1 Tax=Rhizobium sp. RHZ02 TaxID=2769306 RepID=UPI00177D76B5|nr:fumarylacetoacetate hydrolase family protein [Rhizobium sp. RHZ02]MBD9454475.1 fumarylacetoacetate hydrolase family protein [Rhizobium sp. RHZ02]
MKLAFAPPATSVLPIAGSDIHFPVHRIYCVGRNFADHAIEMGHDPTKEPPFFFQKNSDSLVRPERGFPYPGQSEDVHYEVELVIALHKGGSDIPVNRALECVFGYAVGLDMTRRDLQDVGKKMGRPWEVAKAFEDSAPCGRIQLAERIGHPSAGDIWLSVNGERRQSGDLNQMIWKVPEMISYLSKLFTLRPGDLIFAGTPAGVGPIKVGDDMVARIAGVDEISVKVL